MGHATIFINFTLSSMYVKVRMTRLEKYISRDKTHNFLSKNWTTKI